MQEKETSLCFGGNISGSSFISDKQFIRFTKYLEEEIDIAINHGIKTFYISVDSFFDLVCARILLLKKKVIPINRPRFIRLVAVLAFEEQANDWPELDRVLYFNILSECDQVITLKTKYEQDCFYEKNKYLIEHSSTLICCFHHKDVVSSFLTSYAERNNLRIINLLEGDI